MKINIDFDYSFLLQEGIIGSEINEKKLNQIQEKLKKEFDKYKPLIESLLANEFMNKNIILDIECFLFSSTNKDSIPIPFLLNIASNNVKNIFFDLLIILNIYLFEKLNIVSKIKLKYSEEYIKIFSIYLSRKIIKVIYPKDYNKILKGYAFYSFKQYLLDNVEIIESKILKENIPLEKFLE
ncbi:MAG: hypothetical protein ACOC3V_02165 [bacterium]